jgi:hypothetical protein
MHGKGARMMSRQLIPSLAAAAFAMATVPARADDARLDPARNEVAVFGGISILDARTSQQATFTWPAIPGLPGFPGGATGDVHVNTETRLGNSALIGFRYAFYLRKQLALEADVAVAPSQDLRSSVDLCGSSGCFGRGDYGFGGHSVTAWHYGAGLTYDILGKDVRPAASATTGPPARRRTSRFASAPG